MNHFFKYKLPIHIGKIGDSAHKHRTAVLFLSVLAIFIEPHVTVSFGTASLAGLGISVTPPQEIPVGILLFCLLIYRLTSFWVIVLIDSGTDFERAERKAYLELDPGCEAEEHSPSTMEELIRREARGKVLNWTVWQLTWEFLFPNVVAAAALATFITRLVLLKMS